MTPLRPFGLARVIEQALNLGRYGRHNGGVKEHIQTCEQERADNNGDENFYAGVNIALRLLAGDSGANGGNCGVYLVSDFRLQLLYSSLCNLLVLFYRCLIRLCIRLQGGKIGIKKDRKIFICNKEITVYIYDFSSSPGGEAAINSHMKNEV